MLQRLSLALILCAGIARTATPAPGTSFSVDIRPLAAFYRSLSDDEKEEQLRDWALQALLPGAAVTAPVRYPPARGVPDYIVAPGRAAPIPGSPDEIVVLVPAENAADAYLIGRLADDLTQRSGRRPAKAHLYGYSFADSSPSIAVSLLRDIDGSSLYSSTFGYAECRIAAAGDLRRFLQDTDDLTYASWEDGQLVLGGRRRSGAADAAAGLVELATVYQAYAGAAAGAPADMGFSLDPVVDTGGLARDLRALAANDPALVPPEQGLAAFISSHTALITKTANQVRRNGSAVPFIALQQSFRPEDGAAAARFCSLLQKIERDRTCQTARYDGNFKGTALAMTLFYTDLTAKLWALDYGGLAPTGKIAGFVPVAAIKVPKLYWDDFVKYSKTRLWFGLRKESFDVYGRRLYFAPVATRVYAASSDPMTPGRETTPNYQSEQFLGWWDRHYERVADFEPQYHALNQIQKWSCLFTILAEENNHCLDFLQAVPVSRSTDFRKWYADDRKLRSKTTLPFIDGQKFGCRNECLAVLSSADYPLMGRRYFLSGGISLASRKDIAGKLKKARPSSPGQRRAAKVPEPRGTKQPPANPVPAVQPRAPGGQEWGTLNHTAGNETVMLSWEKGEAALLNDLVRTLAAAQDEKRAGYKDEGLFKGLPAIERLVRLEQGKSYLLKTTALKGRWVYLSVNGSGAGFPARASGTEPDADIFSAKCILTPQAAQMINEKHGVTVLP